jgi:hypothetical protein
LFATNHTAPTSDYLIIGFIIRWASVGPTNDHDFFRVLTSGTQDPLSSPATEMGLRLEANGDITLLDAAETVQATATTPVSADTWYIFEVRYLPSSSVGECQVWYKEFGTGSFTDLFGGNQTSLTLGGTYSSMDGMGFQGQLGGANDDTVYFAGSYCMINSTAAADRLDSDFEVIGPYQNNSGVETTVSDHGNNLDAGDWDNVFEIPFSDTAALAEFTGNPDLGGMNFDAGSRAGPSGDARIDGTSNIKAWRAIWRGQRGNGGGGTHSLYVGDDGGTWTAGFDSMAMTLGVTDGNHYFCTDVSTNMPTSTDNFAMGFGTTANRDIKCREMAAFVLHAPDAADVTVPELTTATRIPT